MKLLVIIVLGFTLSGCAHRGVPKASDGFVSLSCVVEEFDPASLVFYALDSIPYDARSRVARVRVVEPAELRGRIFAIDLMEESEKKHEGFDDLRHVGAQVRLRMPAALTKNTEKQLVPIYLLQKEPNQTLEPTAASGRGSS